MFSNDDDRYQLIDGGDAVYDRATGETYDEPEDAEAAGVPQRFLDHIGSYITQLEILSALENASKDDDDSDDRDCFYGGEMPEESSEPEFIDYNNAVDSGDHNWEADGEPDWDHYEGL